ncbi:MAG: glycosyltransferase [Acidobacteriota bacterium]
MPKFSIIIASVNGLPFIEECLASLDDQRGGLEAEIVVVDSTDEKTRDYISRNFPKVNLIRLAARPGIPGMRAIGMREATGDHLVITEDHCIAPENWLEEINRAHLAGYAVVGGSVENGSCSRLVDWAVFLCEYSGFMPPIEAGEVDFVAGNNVSYSRAAIRQVDEAVKNDFWEFFMQEELRRKGIKFLSVPAVKIIHKKDFGFFYFLAQRFHYSRSFAAMRRQRSTISRQLIYLAYAPVSAIHLTWRIVSNVWRKQKHRRELFLSFPFLAMFMCSYALGELVGQLFGPGHSLAKVE